MINEIVKTKYNNSAFSYIKRENSNYQFTHHLKEANKALKTGNFDAVVDIGCGSGSIIRYLSGIYNEIDFIGIDFSEELINIALEKNKNKNLQFYIRDFSNEGSNFTLELTKNYKKILLLVHGALEYYDNKDKLTAEIQSTFNNKQFEGLIVFFLNQNMFLRNILHGNHKKYWTYKQAISFFCCNSNYYKVKYRSFLLFDKLITKSRFFDGFFLFADSLLSYLPIFISKKISTTFEITFLKNVEQKKNS